jgi:hypothetical protein
MISFRVTPHLTSQNLQDQVVEMWRDGVLVAVLYGAPYGVRLISKYLGPGSPRGILQPGEPPVLEIHFETKPYQES